MHRIDNSTAVAALPDPAPAGTPGFFTKGDPVGGIPATVVTDDWANSIQEELVSILTEAGIVPDKAATNQVLLAIQSMQGAMFPFRGIAVYDTAGAHTWDVPEGVTKAWVTVIGGGGPGGGAAQATTSANAQGGGGTGGGCAIKLCDLIGVSSVDVTVAGATNGPLGANTGSPGQSSSFGLFCSATGGNNGTSGSSTAGTGGTGAAQGGIGVGGDINISGSAGGSGLIRAGLNAGANFGGGTYLGGSTPGQTSDADGIAGVGYGAGGGGATSTSNTNKRGGTGAAGVVIIQW